MGGSWSGRRRRGSGKTTAESQKSVDIRWLKRRGLLQAGATGNMAWSKRGEQTGVINFNIAEKSMILNYRYRVKGGEWEDVEEAIIFDRTPCNYGGHRTWFLCPRCGKRIAILYGAGKLFLCRHCYDLTYGSQQEMRGNRLMRKQRRIRERLGASRSLLDPIVFKPKGMHWKTFDRLRQEEARTSNLSARIMGRRIGIW